MMDFQFFYILVLVDLDHYNGSNIFVDLSVSSVENTGIVLDLPWVGGTQEVTLDDSGDSRKTWSTRLYASMLEYQRLVGNAIYVKSEKPTTAQVTARSDGSTQYSYTAPPVLPETTLFFLDIYQLHEEFSTHSIIIAADEVSSHVTVTSYILGEEMIASFLVLARETLIIKVNESLESYSMMINTSQPVAVYSVNQFPIVHSNLTWNFVQGVPPLDSLGREYILGVDSASKYEQSYKAQVSFPFEDTQFSFSYHIHGNDTAVTLGANMGLLCDQRTEDHGEVRFDSCKTFGEPGGSITLDLSDVVGPAYVRCSMPCMVVEQRNISFLSGTNKNEHILHLPILTPPLVHGPNNIYFTTVVSPCPDVTMINFVRVEVPIEYVDSLLIDDKEVTAYNNTINYIGGFAVVSLVVGSGNHQVELKNVDLDDGLLMASIYSYDPKGNCSGVYMYGYPIPYIVEDYIPAAVIISRAATALVLLVVVGGIIVFICIANKKIICCPRRSYGTIKPV